MEKGPRLCWSGFADQLAVALAREVCGIVKRRWEVLVWMGFDKSRPVLTCFVGMVWGHGRGWHFYCMSPMKSYPFGILVSFIFSSDGHFLGAKILFLCSSTCQKLWHKTETYTTCHEQKRMCLVSGTGRIHSPGWQLLLLLLRRGKYLVPWCSILEETGRV